MFPIEPTGFTQDAFDAFLAARDEPAWLTELRRAGVAAVRRTADAAAAATKSGCGPTFGCSSSIGFALPDPAPHESPEFPHALLAAGVELGGRTVSVDSRSVLGELAPELAKQGVLFGSLGRLVAEHGDLLRPFFERHVVDPFKDKFSALNAACWSGGPLLYVPKGVRIEAAAALAVGAGRRRRRPEQDPRDPRAGCRSDAALGNGQHDCRRRRAALRLDRTDRRTRRRLRYVNLQNWGHEVWHFAHQKAHVGREGRLQWTIGALGAKLAKVNQHVAMIGPDAEVQVNGVMFTEGRQHLSYNTHQHHMAPYCRSDLLYKAALQDRSRTVWRGMIKVDKVAQRTDAYQRNDNLMLSRDARADSIPGLEIEADDVRCTHGSTSGRVDEGQVFYAMTRGYTRREAVRMIVAGFFQQVFDRITIESVRDALGEAIGRRVSDIEELAAE